VTKDDKEIVSALRGALVDKVGTARYEVWFGDSTRFHLQEGALTVIAPTEFFRQWIRSNFRQAIDEACRDASGQRMRLEFAVDLCQNEASPDGEAAAHPCENRVSENTLSGNITSSENAVSPATSQAASFSATPTRHGDEHLAAGQQSGHRGRERKRRPIAGGENNGRLNNRPGNNGAESRGTDAVSTAGARMPSGGRRRRLASLDDCVAGETNRVALAAAHRCAKKPGGTPLFLYGPTSVGKTHLLEGVWTAARAYHPQATIIYQSAEQFTSQFLEALRGSGLPSFRRKFRSVDLLILDDLHFLIGKRATRTELLHTVDTMLRAGRQLVFAADRPPTQLTGLGVELITRLQSGLVCAIDPPDFATRLGISKHMAERFELDVPEDVHRYIASKFAEHAREISGALCRLRATSEALDQPITLELAKQALGELIRQGGPVVRLPDIERAVCEVLDIEAGSLHAPGRSRNVSHPRMLAMWLARKHTRAALSEIGTYFGRRRHSTVVSAQRRIEGWMAEGASVQVADSHWNVDDAIRQIERRLKAG